MESGGQRILLDLVCKYVSFIILTLFLGHVRRGEMNDLPRTSLVSRIVSQARHAPRWSEMPLQSEPGARNRLVELACDRVHAAKKRREKRALNCARPRLRQAGHARKPAPARRGRGAASAARPACAARTGGNQPGRPAAFSSGAERAARAAADQSRSCIMATQHSLAVERRVCHYVLRFV